jgi:hypothetical protein
MLPKSGFGGDPLQIENLKITTRELSILIAKRRDVIRILDALGIITFPCIYLLLELKSNRVYIGETSDVRDRISQHKNFPPLDWEYCVLIWNGRFYGMSIFDSEGLRKRLEFEVNQLFRSYSNLEVVSTAHPIQLEANEESRMQEILDEIIYLFSMVMQPNLINLKCFEDRLKARKKWQISQIPLKVEENEIDIEKIITLMRQEGLNITELNRAEKTFRLNGEICFYRPGSLKPKGYQVTIRGTFLEHMKLGKGFLLMNRGLVYIIPLKEINEKFGNLLAPGQDTLDIFFDLQRGEIVCHDKTISLGDFELEVMLQKLRSRII